MDVGPMWYDKRGMRSIFYIGVMLICIGLGLHLLGFKIPAIILICVGVACVIVGFNGLLFNAKILTNRRK